MYPSGLIPASLSKTLYYPEKIHWLQAIQRQICLNRSLYTVSSGKLRLEGCSALRGWNPNGREWSMGCRKHHLEFTVNLLSRIQGKAAHCCDLFELSCVWTAASTEVQLANERRRPSKYSSIDFHAVFSCSVSGFICVVRWPDYKLVVKVDLTYKIICILIS